MTPLESALNRTRKTILEVCRELGIEYTDSLPNIDQCNSCGIWLKKSKLIPDLDKNPICNECLTFYGP